MGRPDKSDDRGHQSSTSSSDEDDVSPKKEDDSLEKQRDRKLRSRKHKDDRQKKSKTKRRKRSRSPSDDNESPDQGERKNSRKKRKREDEQSYSSSSSDFSDSSSEVRQSKKKKKKKQHKESSKKKKKDKKNKRKSSKKGDDGVPVFGKYGVLKGSDFHKQQRSFTVWLEEVKGIMSFNGPKWELQNYFKDYIEDFNTATLPHIKYYDYDKWEMEEYRKNKTSSAVSQKSSAQRDEALHMLKLQEQAKAKRQDELDLVRNMMSQEKREEMKYKAELQSQMAHAYKIGDHETYQRLKARLEPEK